MSSLYRTQRFNNNADDAYLLPSEGPWDIPVILPEAYEPVEWIPFSNARPSRHQDRGLHFFLDDYMFDRVWHYWKEYAEVLSQYSAVMTPAFSTYRNWPYAVQLWNHYRKHFVGAYLQSIGMKVYPSISWSDEGSYEWCFDGEPHNATVCISTVGTQADPVTKEYFRKGYEEMMRRLTPETVVIYGNVPKWCEGNIVHVEPYLGKFKKKEGIVNELD